MNEIANSRILSSYMQRGEYVNITVETSLRPTLHFFAVQPLELRTVAERIRYKIMSKLFKIHSAIDLMQ